MAIVGDGLHFAVLEGFMDVTDLNVSTICYALNVTGGGYRAWRDRGVLPKPASNIIMQLVEIYAFGYSHFGHRRNFNGWMLEPNLRLGMIPPMSLISDEFGLKELSLTLKRMDALILEV